MLTEVAEVVFDNWKKEFLKTDYNSFGLLRPVDPNNDEEWDNYVPDQNMLDAVENIQIILSDEIYHYLDYLVTLEPLEAFYKVWGNTAKYLRSYAGDYGITDTASRDAVYYELYKLFTQICPKPENSPAGKYELMDKLITGEDLGEDL